MRYFQNKEFKIIAETAFSHEGNFDYLLEQIRQSYLGKCDAIKFQVFLDISTSYESDHPAYNTINNWLLTKSQWQQAFKLAKSYNLEIIALPLNTPTLVFLKQIKEIDYIEIHSICFNQYDLLLELKDFSKKLVLGIGGRYQSEIDFIKRISKKKDEDLVLMHGFQSFPTNIFDVNLSKINEYKKIYPCSILGYADHSIFSNDDYLKLNNYAYLLGARWFEKHIVVDKGQNRTDYQSAIASYDFIEMRSSIDELIKILGESEINILNEKELIYRNREKKLVTLSDIKPGETFSLDNVGYIIKEESGDFYQSEIERIIGRHSSKFIKKGETIKFYHLS